MAARERSTFQPATFRVLGPLEVISGNGQEIPITQHVHRAALAVMLLRAGDVCPRSWLTEAIWGERPPASGHTALRTAVYGLRQELRDHDLGGRIQTRQAGPRPGGYMIETRDGEVDLHSFRALTAAGRDEWYRGKADRAASALGEAVHLWRADLPDLPATPVLAPEAAQLRAEFRAAQDMWMDARLALGQHEDAVAGLRRILNREPLREHTWAQLMRALYRCGDKAGAVAASSAARAALAAGYGAGPGPELAELLRQVLADSPDLTWGGAAGEMRSQLPAQADARQGTHDPSELGHEQAGPIEIAPALSRGSVAAALDSRASAAARPHIEL